MFCGPPSPPPDPRELPPVLGRHELARLAAHTVGGEHEQLPALRRPRQVPERFQRDHGPRVRHRARVRERARDGVPSVAQGGQGGPRLVVGQAVLGGVEQAQDAEGVAERPARVGHVGTIAEGGVEQLRALGG